MLRYLLLLLIAALTLPSCESAALKVEDSEINTPRTILPDTASPIPDDCGGQIGDTACNITFVSNEGLVWSLYDHYGTIVILDFSAIWCGVCKHIAPDAQNIQDHYTDLGHDVLWVTVLVDGSDYGVPPTADEIAEWVSDYGMTTSPVLMGDRSIIDHTAEEGYPVNSWPTIVVVGQNMEIIGGVNGWNQSLVMSWVDQALGIN